MTRATIPIDDEVLAFSLAHAEALGLPANASQSRVLQRVLDLGAQSLMRMVRDQAREDLYAEWANDPERLEAVADHDQAASQTGAY